MGSTLHRNALFSFLSALFRLSANAVLFVLVARFYGPEGFGQFTTAHTLATIFILFADFGFDIFLTTEIARHPERSSEIAPRMAANKLVFALGGSTAMGVYASFQAPSSVTSHLTYIFCLYLFFSALLNFMFAFFRAHERMEYESLVTLIINVALVIALILSGIFNASLFIVAAAFVGSRVLGLILVIQKSRTLISSMRPIFDFEWTMGVLKRTSVFGVHLIFGNLFFAQDTILLSAWKGDHEVGIYQSVFRLIAIVLIVPEIAVASTLPRLSRLYENERPQWYALGSFANKMLFFIGVLTGFILIVLPETIIHLAYGSSGYGEAVPVLRIFGYTVVIRYMFEVPALMLTTSHRQVDRMKLVIGATLFNFAVNAIAIPTYGVVGAAVVSLVTNVLVGLGYVLVARREFSQDWLGLQRILPLVVVAILCLLAMEFFPSIQLWHVVALTVPSYLVAVYLLGFSNSERNQMVRVIGRSTTQ